ncbi:MAG: EAL domain-containing protein [Actinobacteria bacterium]|nr:EAL domain-containing protein [Actinomycetota bacterium]
MEVGLTLGLVLLVITVPVGAGLALYAWRSRELPGALTFAVMIPLAMLWALGGVGELTAEGLQAKLLWANIQYVSIAFFPVAWLALALDYTRRRAWLTRGRVLALCLIPFATQVMVWTNGSHHLMRATVWLDTSGSYPVVGRTFGPWFWLHCAYSYTLMGIALAIIAAALVTSPYFYRRQPLALLVGSLIPLGTNIAFVFFPDTAPAFDYTPVAATLGGTIIAWGIFQLRVFSLVPVARHTLVENMPDGVLVLDKNDRVIDLNRSAQALIDRPASYILSRPISASWDAWGQVVAPQSAGAGQADLRLGSGGGQRHYEVKWSPLIRHGRAVGRVVVLGDVTERVLMEENLRQQTLTDGLTGLPNRALFMARLEDAIRLARRHKDGVFAVMVLDLDWFKHVNDSIGHLAGDALLRSVAAKLKRCVREVDTVARMGGDEFMILLNSITSARDVLPILDRIQEELRSPVYFRQQEMTAACSVGVVMWNPSYDDPESLLRAADTAMYQAKDGGRGCHRIFDEEMHRSVMRTLKAETDLLTGIRQKRFSLAYQPIIELETGKIRSLEALLRWHHPERGTVFPDDFVALAESSGLIVRLGELALERVCDQISRWRLPANSVTNLPVSLNLSPRQLIEPDFVGTVMDRLADWQIPPDRLILEITEAALIRDPLKSKKTMQTLRDVGIRLCLDDFGAGWSSLQHLTTFPVQELKIDHVFTSKIARGNTDFEVVRSLIALAHTLGLHVTAEGIENSEQWRLLQEIGCDCGQGYYVGNPMEPAELAQYLEDLQRGSCPLLEPAAGESGRRALPIHAVRPRGDDGPVWRPHTPGPIPGELPLP